MQFFYLLSFAVAASYAAALPQPAELSEKYPNNVDNNLASGLEARSYQPESNSHKDSPTLVSLKRRDDSEGSSGEDSGSDSLPPPATTPKKTNGVPFTKGDINIMNLAHIIDNVGDGSVDLYKDGEKAGKKIDNPVGGLVAKYLRRYIYVNIVLKQWIKGSLNNTLFIIKSILGNREYSRIRPGLLRDIQSFEVRFSTAFKAASKGVSNILNEVDSVADNIQRIEKSFENTLYSRTSLLLELKLLLEGFEGGETLKGHLSAAVKSIDDFLRDQGYFYLPIMKGLGFDFSQ
ncbi:hypothetical protein BASA50_003307 [Batrachochytrium salamandrivorans]|uniref:Uncharacterized protein n=1 Tax=Batrachochytrium salamandrivorans TaxID=1357716 RepID=A0ABQ8FLQ0_9FUNG|nr:hypothetical protein BASA50_003307 [Batrachochytrium salamandrivorans]KAH9269832.1 hypothetical protein BASA83_008149 [Batrachochytrium salamandrivorans]